MLFHITQTHSPENCPKDGGKESCGVSPLTPDSSPMQGQAFEVSISRTYLVLLAEFGGKGDR